MQQKTEIKSKKYYATQFLDTFAHLVKINTYYPEGHEIFTQAALGCIENLKKLLEKGEQSVQLSIGQENCSIAGITIKNLSQGAEEVRQLFFSIGLYHLRFNIRISSRELQKFIIAIMEWRIQAHGSQTFTFFSKTNFPNITIQQQQFNTDAEARNDDVIISDTESLYGGIGRICRTLVDKGYSRNDVMRCRDFLIRATESGELIQTDVSNSNRSSSSLSLSNSAKNLRWEDILNLIINILDSKENQGSTKQTTDINALSAIFEHIAKNKSSQSGQQAIGMLMELFANNEEKHTEKKEDDEPEKKKEEVSASPSQQAEDKAAEEQEKQSGDKLSQEEARHQRRNAINEFVGENEFPAEELKKLDTNDKSEDISILLHLILLREEKTDISNRIFHIQKFCNHKLTPQEKEILLSGLQEIAIHNRFTDFYATIKDILDAMRYSHNNPPLRFILDLHNRLDRKHKKFTWAFLVNEALLTGTEDNDRGDNNRKDFIAAIRKAIAINYTTMKSLRIYLNDLDAFNSQDRPLASGIFVAKEVQCYSLYGLLLETSIGQEIAIEVIAGLRTSPQDTFITCLAPLIKLNNESDKELLKDYLLYRPGNTLPRRLENKGAALIAEWLMQSPHKHLDEQKLITMIKAVGKFGDASLIQHMEQIRTEKKMLLGYLWSKACRKAAETALYSLRKEQKNERANSRK